MTIAIVMIAITTTTNNIINPIVIYKHGKTARDNEDTDKTAHEKEAEKYGTYVGNPVIGAIVRTLGEIGQFFFYSVT
jgi:hypothetical protein